MLFSMLKLGNIVNTISKTCTYHLGKYFIVFELFFYTGDCAYAYSYPGGKGMPDRGV